MRAEYLVYYITVTRDNALLCFISNFVSSHLVILDVLYHVCGKVWSFSVTVSKTNCLTFTGFYICLYFSCLYSRTKFWEFFVESTFCSQCFIVCSEQQLTNDDDWSFFHSWWCSLHSHTATSWLWIRWRCCTSVLELNIALVVYYENNNSIFYKNSALWRCSIRCQIKYICRQTYDYPNALF